MNLTVGVLVIPSRGTEPTLNGVLVETDPTHDFKARLHLIAITL